MLVMPATSPISRNFFSALELVKAYLPSIHYTSRLNHALTLLIRKQEIDFLDLEICANVFACHFHYG